jgi:hypothetical protein
VRLQSYRALLEPVVLLCLAGCADLLDIPDDPMVVGSLKSACIDSPARAPKPTSDRAVVRVHACNFVTNCLESAAGLTATLCSKLDVECADPVEQMIRDVNGDLAFQVPTGGVSGAGFDGYLRISTPRASCTDDTLFGAANGLACSLAPGCDKASPGSSCMIPVFLDSMLFFNPAITVDALNPLILPLIPTAASFGLIAAADARTADISTGFVFVTVLDCDGTPAAGATVDIMPRPASLGGTLYLADGVPNAGVQATDASGVAGLLGVPKGFRQIVASKTGATSTSRGSVGVQVGPSMVTYVNIVLSPAED